MQHKKLKLIGVTACFALAAGPALADGHCAQYGQFRSTHMHDDRLTMDITTVRGDEYRVHFTGYCKVGGEYSTNHFVYTDLMVGTCVSTGDTWPTSRLGPCFVQSVDPVTRETN